MLAEITWHQFLEWSWYADLEPFDEIRADYRNAHVVQTLVNMNRARNASARPLGDFVLYFGEEGRPQKTQTWQEQKAIAYMIATGQQGPPP